MPASGSHTLIHAHWRAPLRGFPPVTIRPPKAFPSGEGGSRVPRKRETDEGLAAHYGRGAGGGEGFALPSQSASPPAPPKGEPRGNDSEICSQVF